MLDASLRLRKTNCFAPLAEVSRRYEWIETPADAHKTQSTRTESRYLKFEISNPQSEIHQPQFIILLASTIERGQIEAIIKAMGAEEHLDLRIIEGDAANALAHAEIAVVASGTATVEAALLKTPMVIVYRASEVNYRLLRPLIHLDMFGMVNLIAGRKVVPELIQRDVSGAEIAREVEAILSNPDRLAEMQCDLETVRERLCRGSGSASERAARAVMSAVLK
jgi:lipid-A-disaccharide synthase